MCRLLSDIKWCFDEIGTPAKPCWVSFSVNRVPKLLRRRDVCQELAAGALRKGLYKGTPKASSCACSNRSTWNLVGKLRKPLTLGNDGGRTTSRSEVLRFSCSTWNGCCPRKPNGDPERGGHVVGTPSEKEPGLLAFWAWQVVCFRNWTACFTPPALPKLYRLSGFVDQHLSGKGAFCCLALTLAGGWQWVVGWLRLGRTKVWDGFGVGLG